MAKSIPFFVIKQKRCPHYLLNVSTVYILSYPFLHNWSWKQADNKFSNVHNVFK